MNKRLLVLTAVPLLFGCSTPYQSKGLRGGYSETQLQENVFQIQFKGNGYTSGDKCTDLALLRCAEITLENGFTYFSIMDSAADSTSYMSHSGGMTRTYGTTRKLGNNYVDDYNSYDTGIDIPVTKSNASYMIRCFDHDPGNGAFDAKWLSDSVRKKYKI